MHFESEILIVSVQKKLVSIRQLSDRKGSGGYMNIFVNICSINDPSTDDSLSPRRVLIKTENVSDSPVIYLNSFLKPDKGRIQIIRLSEKFILQLVGVCFSLNILKCQSYRYFSPFLAYCITLARTYDDGMESNTAKVFNAIRHKAGTTTNTKYAGQQ